MRSRVSGTKLSGTGGARRRGHTPESGAVAMARLRRLAAGHAISSYGSYLNMVALNVFAFQISGSAAYVGAFLALRLAAAFAVGLVAGGLVTRCSRKAVMISSDLGQAAALVAFIALPHVARPVALLVLATITGAGSSLHAVALRSSVPEIVGQEQRMRANAALATGRSLAMVAGFASAGVMIASAGYEITFAVDAMTFVVSAVNLAWLPVALRAGSTVTEAAGGRATRRATIIFLWSVPVLLAMIGVRAVDAFGSAAHNVGLPIRSSAVDPQHPATFMAQFWAVWAVGNITAQRLVSWWSGRTGRSIGERAFALGATAMSAAFIAAFLDLPVAVGVVVALAAGAADGFTENVYLSRLQSVPDDQRGYVFALSSMSDNLAFGLGMVVATALLDSFEPLAVVAVMHGAAITLALLFLVVLAVRGRRQPVMG